MPQPKEQKELSGNSVIEVVYKNQTLIKMDAFSYIKEHLVMGVGAFRWYIPDGELEIYINGVRQIPPTKEP